MDHFLQLYKFYINAAYALDDTPTIFSYFEVLEAYETKVTLLKRDIIKHSYLIIVRLRFAYMEVIRVLDTDANQRNPSQDRVTTLGDLIYETQGSQVVPSDPDRAMGDSLTACQSLDQAIHPLSVHSPFKEKDQKFLDGV